MNEIIIFENPEFGQVRTTEINGEPWFIGKDVADILGYSNPQKALRDHIDEEDKLTERFVLSGQNREAIIINESGLYSLILSSKLPNAKKFKRWVTSEVLPSIRKNGGYINNQENMTPEQIMAAGLEAARKIIASKDKQIEAMRPKEIFADAVSASKDSILIGELAKILKQNGVDMGQKRLFEWLRENGYLIKQRGQSWNMPTQKAMEAGLFEVKETTVTHGDGHISINKTTKVTGKGQIYFTNKFLKKKESGVAV